MPILSLEYLLKHVSVPANSSLTSSLILSLVLGASYNIPSLLGLCLCMLKFKKVYIDSSYKVNGTSSEFTIDLPETVQLEDNMLCQIHEVSIPHSWYSINNTNNNVYFRHQVLPPGIPSGAIYRKIPIPEGNYNTASELTTELETQLNNYFDTSDRPNTYTVRYNATTSKINQNCC